MPAPQEPTAQRVSSGDLLLASQRTGGSLNGRETRARGLLTGMESATQWVTREASPTVMRFVN